MDNISINKLENVIKDLKEKLLPNREEQFNIMSAPYYKKIKEIKMR